MRSLALFFAVALVAPSSSGAFQIGPTGPRTEARHTNEPESTLVRTAGRIGRVIKAPVHEEITQLGFGCPVDRASLSTDKLCGSPDRPYASAFVIYGVRWNDVPPFKLATGEGKCSFYGKRCLTAETIRFTTQPMCWFCLFDSASKTAGTRPIAGCGAGPNESRGNLMTRSHFGDLQFLHGMAAQAGEDAVVTQAQVLDWLEFAWKVGSREIKPSEKLREINIPTIRDRFSCTEWTVSELYILGHMSSEHGLAPRLNQIAFGSLLHTIQDSFAAGHVEREADDGTEMCGSTNFRMPPRIIEFHNYSAQDGTLHDHEDTRSALVETAEDDWPRAVEATRNLAKLYEDRESWEAAKAYLRCLVALVPNARSSSAGLRFSRKSGVTSSLRD